MLEKDLAGIRLEGYEREKGAVVLIPAGDVIRVDPTAPHFRSYAKG
jgi:hypothetical protein